MSTKIPSALAALTLIKLFVVEIFNEQIIVQGNRDPIRIYRNIFIFNMKCSNLSNYSTDMC